MLGFKRWNWLCILPGVLIGLSFLMGLYRSNWGPAVARSGEKKTAGTQPVPRVVASPLVGTFSCSARGCHGAIEPHGDPQDLGKVWQNEYTQWTHDRHSNAYRVLFNERSEKIAKLLGNTKAHEDPRCLACHTNPVVAKSPSDDPSAAQEKRFGVGCESCHGNADRYLVPHTDKSWRQRSPQEKAKQGMVAVEDPFQRAEACAGCHVGAPPRAAKGFPVRDVNHDLIAAGHPRLAFEFGAFQANMPSHWRPYDKRDAREKPIPDERLWTVGQLVSAQAALDLLIHRADSAQAKTAPWPEFAEYDCFACHHSLAQPTWRQNADRGNRKPGALPWGSWYFALTRALGERPALTAALDELEKTMQRPYPLPKDASARAKTARTVLQTLANDWSQGDAGARQRILALIAKNPPALAESWDSAEQIYLALYALLPSPALDGLANERAFPSGFDSPVSSSAKGVNSFHPRDFLEKLRTVPK